MAERNNQTLETLATIERGDGEQIRLTIESFTSDDGQAHVYCSARKWYKDNSGTWRPTKSGLSIRKTELMAWGKGLRAALDYLNANGGESSLSERLPPRQPTAAHGQSGPGDARQWDRVF